MYIVLQATLLLICKINVLQQLLSRFTLSKLSHYLKNYEFKKLVIQKMPLLVCIVLTVNYQKLG